MSREEGKQIETSTQTGRKPAEHKVDKSDIRYRCHIHVVFAPDKKYMSYQS